MAELAAVQHWVQRAIFAGGASADFAGEVVAGNDRLTPAQRVGIYAGGYRARLLECLRDEFKVLRMFVGETAFDLFAAGYLAEHRSRHPSLYDLGAGFADHLERQAPPEAAEKGSIMAAPAQLARLERARSESLRATGVERERLPVTADLALMPGSRIRVPDSVRLLRLDFDFGPVVAAAERGAGGAPPEPADWAVAVARSGWRVRIHRLDPWRFAFIEALAPAGGDVHAAAAAAARAAGRDTGSLIADLVVWLPVAAAAGLVARA
ncbi:MAG TPA: DNA-binding domain-containing protein [Allosphingosinicella sp.]|nr:DNA-binding domain-containing protein [Allosphingosinicella sp.]